ncbi:MAG: sugar-binding domain-containing protein [Pontiellaceae bacterium]
MEWSYCPFLPAGGLIIKGPSWYRKQFSLPPAFAGKRVFVHFEGIMGASKVWVNGVLIEHSFWGIFPDSYRCNRASSDG